MHEWYSSNKASFRKAKMAKYGTTPEVVTQAFADQKGLCAICGRPPVVNKRGGLHVDHDHSAKKFRALLCNNCNLMLGHAKDDPARLRAAADYLEKHRKL